MYRNLIEVQFESVVFKQHYVNDRPCFRPEAIGVLRQGKAYFTEKALAEKTIARWSTDCHMYRLMGMRVVPITEVPRHEMVHVGEGRAVWSDVLLGYEKGYYNSHRLTSLYAA